MDYAKTFRFQTPDSRHNVYGMMKTADAIPQTVQVRRAGDRGRTALGWLDSRHSFSFGRYYDPAHMGVSDLRVLNEDRVRPGAGFEEHSHRDMEIVSVVVAGAMAHADSTGRRGVIRPGDVQRMTAGSGIVHSEYNASQSESLHFLQIWLRPAWSGLAPGYEQRHFDDDELHGRLRPIVAGDGREGALTLHQDAVIHRARLDAGEEVVHETGSGRRLWVQMIAGAAQVAGERLAAGDGAALGGVEALPIRAETASDLLLFDLRDDGRDDAR